ncbi:hypothetical protein [Thalassotalea aquiviva]|uniref:hypothetical protein n=1 Tax=Thalassotalea aquiviva TaxID=3242415 RepID=UPI00352AA427
MNKIVAIVLIMLINCICFESALAQDKNTALVPLPLVDDFTKSNDGWAFGLGLGIAFESTYEGLDEFRQA